MGVLAAALAASAPSAAAGTPAVTVRLLEKYRPDQAVLSRPGERHEVAVGGGGLLLDGSPVRAPLRFVEAGWRIAVAGTGAREYRAALAFGVDAGRLAIVATMPLEEYVAAVVASETVPGTPLEALKAQAVVTRSYALATRGRHGGADLCDLAHCQVLAARAPGAHRAASRAAARATAGEVLRLPSGRVAQAPFHASCGGNTGDPVELFGGDETGAGSVPDPGCPLRPWTAVVPAPVLASVARDLFPGAAPPSLADLAFHRGAGGFVVQVALADRLAGGESFARALDRAMGYGVVRSSRFRATADGDRVVLSGSGLGHGVGLCQAGSSRRAAAGVGYRAILAHYFPGAHLARR